MNKPFARVLRQKLVMSRTALFAERAWSAFMPLVLAVVAFLAVTFFGLWQAMPVWLHALLLMLFAAAFVYVVRYAWRSLYLPQRDAALLRLERDSGIRHEALQALEDELPGAVHDPDTEAFWKAHRERLFERVKALQVSLPTSDVPKRDPWAIRTVPVLVLALALVDGWGDFRTRLADAFTFAGPVRAAPEPVMAELWITPPDYTRRAPLGPAQTAEAEQITVPEGSTAILQLRNVPAVEQGLDARLLYGADAMPIEDMGGGSARAEIELGKSGELVFALGVRGDGEIIDRWPIDIVSDTRPEIAFVDQPSTTHRGVLRIDYEAKDDHGLALIELRFRAHQGADSTIHRYTLSEPAALPTELESSNFLDLTAHPLAGLPVEMVLEARDPLDQLGESEPLVMTLPERTFTHPLARAVIQERKRLVSEPDSYMAVAGRLDVLGDSEAARELPITVPLSFSIASRRLAGDRPADEKIPDVVDMLWDLALFIENGTLSVAEQNLRELQEAFQRAIEEGASEQELAELLDEIERAMNEMLQEMMRQAMQNQQRMDPQSMQEIDPSQVVTQRDLQEMLDQARELMQQGMMDAAQEMMAQLQQMLENMQMAMAQMQRQPSPGEEAVSDLQRMIEMQQNLLDRSFDMNRQMQGQQGQQGQEGQQGQQAQQGQQGQQQPGEMGQGQQGQGGQGLQSQMGNAAMEQDALRRALGELMRRMGEAGMEIPRALGQAELQMRQARDSLQGGAPDPAANAQGDALDFMRQAGQAMMEQLRQQLAQQPGQGMTGQPMPTGREGRDPLGRSQRNQGGFDTYGTHVPDENDLGRARDVLEELYRRSGDLSRPPSELDYIDRLLDRF